MNCRTCYALTLTKDERDRFYREPMTMPAYYCPEHQSVQDEILASLGDWQRNLIEGGFPKGLQFPRFAGKR